MIPFSYIFVGIVGATVIPEYAALYLVSNLRAVGVKYLSAAAVGLTFWFFYDTIGGALSLQVNNSVYPPSAFNGLSHFGVIGAFIGGLVTLAVFDHFALQGPSRSQDSGLGTGPNASRRLFLIPVAIAVVMGMHSLGEGWDAASAVAGATVSNSSILGSLIQAFGTLPAVISYPFHKFLEASIIGVAYAAFVSMSGGAVRTKWWDIPLLGLLFAAPSVIGAAFGYYVGLDTEYFYSFGVVSAFYAALRLVESARPGFKIGANAPAYLGWKTFLAVGLGFFLLYSAALLH